MFLPIFTSESIILLPFFDDYFLQASLQYLPVFLFVPSHTAGSGAAPHQPAELSPHLETISLPASQHPVPCCCLRKEAHKYAGGMRIKGIVGSLSLKKKKTKKNQAHSSSSIRTKRISLKLKALSNKFLSLLFKHPTRERTELFSNKSPVLMSDTDIRD